MGENETPTASKPPKDRIQTFLNAARTACVEQRDYYKSRVNDIKTGQLNDVGTVREFESCLEDQNRYQFGIEQIEILMRYLA